MYPLSESSTAHRKPSKFSRMSKLIRIVEAVVVLSGVVSLAVSVPVVWGWIEKFNEERTPITITTRGDVNRCAVIEGTANRRDGRQLWFAHRDDRDPVHYFFKRATLRDNNRWNVIVHLGRPDNVKSKYEVFAFYVSDDTSRFVDGIDTSSVNGPAGTFWMSQDLPPTASGTVSAYVTRKGDPRDCGA